MADPWDVATDAPDAQDAASTGDPWAVAGADPWAVAPTAQPPRTNLQRFTGNLVDGLARSALGQLSRQIDYNNNGRLDGEEILGHVQVDSGGVADRALKTIGINIGQAPRITPANQAERDRRQGYEAQSNADPFYKAPGGFMGKTAAGASTLAGQFVGAGMSPENWVSPGKTVVGRAAGQAGVSAGADALLQGNDVQSGVQDAWSPVQTVAAAGLGAGVSLGSDAAASVGRRAIDAFKARQAAPKLQTPEAGGAVADAWAPVASEPIAAAPVAKAANSPVADIVRAEASRAGVDPDTALTIARLESNLDPKAANPKSSAAGVFQFTDQTWKGMGGGDKLDPALNAARGADLLRQNADALSSTLGRPPEPWELYLAHQQGLGGASAILRAGDVSAADALKGIGVSEKRAKASIVNNGGREDMSASEFAGLWRQKYEAAGGGKDTNIVPFSGDGARAGGDGWQTAGIEPDRVPSTAREPQAATEPRTIDAGDLWSQTPEALENLLKHATESDDEKLVRALGGEQQAAEFKRLDRARNSMDPARADPAGAEFDQKFGNLTPDQERLIYGIGETGAQPDDIRAVLDAHRDVHGGDPDSWLAYQAAIAARRTSAGDFGRVSEGKASPTAQANFVRMQKAYEGLSARGVPANEIPQRMAGALVETAGWRPEQAAEIIGGFVEDFTRRHGRASARTDDAPFSATPSAPRLEAPRVQAPDMVDLALDHMRSGRRSIAGTGPSMLDYIAKRGGIADPGGELSALDADRWHREQPFRSRLLREDGMSLGDAAVHLQEAGYLPQRFSPDGADDTRATPAELMEAIRKELAGDPRFAGEDAERVAEIRSHVDDLDEILTHLGIDPAKLSNAEVKAQIARAFSDSEPDPARRFAMVAENPRARPPRVGDGKGLTGSDLAKYRQRLASRNPGGLREAPRPGAVPVAGAEAYGGATVSDLASRLRKSLGITHRQGRMTLKGRAVGEFDPNSAVIRTKAVQELDVLSHEATHALEHQQGPALKAALKKHGAELKKLAYPGAAQSVQREEGFAEFGRWYVTNPDHARKIAPDFYEAFEDALFKDRPDVLRDLKDVQGAYRNILSSASLEVAAGSVAMTGRPGPFTRIAKALEEQGVGGAISNLADTAYTAFVDDLQPLNKAVRALQDIYAKNNGGKRVDVNAAQNPYALARLAREAYAAGHLDLMEGVVPYRGTDPEGPSLAQALEHALGEKGLGKWDKKALAQLDAYLIARRMVHEWDRYAGGELDRPPDRNTKEFHQQVIADAEAANPTWKEAAQLVYDWNGALWKKRLDSGLITKKAFDHGNNTHPDYVPLMRDVSDKGASFGPRRPRGGMQFAGGAKQFGGSTRDILSPLSSMMREAYELNGLIRRNDIIKALDDLAQKAGPGAGEIVERIPAHESEAIQVDAVEALTKAAQEAGLSERDMTSLVQSAETMLGDARTATLFKQREISPQKGEAIVFAWRDGKKTPILLADGDFGEALFNSISGMNKEMSNFLVDTMATGTQLLRHGVTLSPEFMSRNIVRDQLATWINTDVGYVPGVHFAKGAVEAVKNGQLSKRYQTVGGMRGGMATSALKRPFPRNDAEAHAQLQHLRKKGYRIRTYNPFTHPLQGLAALTDLSEAGTRLGVMGLAFKQAKKRGMSDLDAMTEAAYQSRDYLDFGRHGSRTLTAARVVTFLNAAVQSLDKTARVLTASGDNRPGLGNLRRVLAPMGGNAPRTPAERRALTHAYKAWAKVGALAVLGGSLRVLYGDDPEYEEIGDNLRATHWFFKAQGEWVGIPKPFELAELSNIVERAYEAKVLKDPKAPDRMWSDFAQVIAPPSEIPALAVPYHIAKNRDFNGRPIVPDHLRGTVDPELQFNSYTSELGKKIGKALKVSPAIVDYVITGFGGSLGRYVLQGGDMAVQSATGAPKTEIGPEDAFVARGFVRDVTRGSTSQKQFWDLVSKTGGTLTQAEGSFRSYMKAGDNAKAAAYLNDMDPNARAYVVAKVLSQGGTSGIHPIVRAQEAVSVIGDIRQEVRDGSLTDMRGQPIDLTPTQRRDADRALGDMGMTEMRNALIQTGQKGWAQKRLLSRGEPMAALGEANGSLPQLVRMRLLEQKVLPAGVSSQVWSRLRPALEQEANPANLGRALDAKRLKSGDQASKRGEVVRQLQSRSMLPPTQAQRAAAQ